MKLIDGKKIAERIKDQVALEIHQLNGPRPNLAIILANDRPDSKLYVSLKEIEAKKVGVDTHLYRLEDATSAGELLGVVDFLNIDEMIDGILVQLPLPDIFDTDKVIAAIDPNKDVDGFHPNHPDYIVSPVFASVLIMLEEIKCSLLGKKICVLFNSSIFGESLKQILEKEGALVNLCPVGNFNKLSEVESNLKYEAIKKVSLEADILITALGLPHFVKKEMLKPGVVIIDIGITKLGGKVLGDVDAEDVKDVASYLTPVPGGVGPMTIALLFKNVWEIFKRKKLNNQ
ncbi:bifunctional methylenetetrahydrofolate dehydrogenase/methenyltetrahydrofolate cyclohydrolase [Candidatus Falkowbacteria bacterium CG10_big_fil_rev_8_21_14_0_10_39_9]|uniref:Bifunctional protein FolD n=1 Tax=Candidatus Falkowbacteria bacterium CG10_big_fil_rev_8_21_14_0_10_39_9 TaxID=1974566 RepID=A0A2M6WNL2_9BACT|nr:MAG: bifunctional methylenetetrahydrofolate dehydrogenase/methenyltetrahydrofolate cyclohydrolase [Candidatus Falkowbacteria bacterium CG10_big_fil_rev_8_21_14_0_10_39_9]